jgi:hypothetical protein
MLIKDEAISNTTNHFFFLKKNKKILLLLVILLLPVMLSFNLFLLDHGEFDV